MARRRRISREFKFAAVSRLATSDDVRGLANELGIDRGLLYKWQRAYSAGGAEALRLPGERSGRVKAATSDPGIVAQDKVGPVPAPAPSVAALERKIAQQQMELDFFRAALRHVREDRRSSGGPGETGSTQ